MAKRKRGDTETSSSLPRQERAAGAGAVPAPNKAATRRNGVATPPSKTPSQPLSVQIVTGSYERVLHGLTATVPPGALTRETPPQHVTTTFSDNFLFAAHSSAIRCLALSPTSGDADQKRVLATGSTDERINLYTLSTVAPAPTPKTGADASVSLPTLSDARVLENPRNKELGSLLHHSRAVTRLHFPNKSKLFSAAEDNTIAISRTRDWTVLSTIKAPIPKPYGRPSGDTAAPGEVPAGVNDFGIHPSMKMMVSVGKGERCMRLWDLVRGKKAGVLQFERDVLTAVGEGKHGTGEGRQVAWSDSGEEFVVGFERGAVVYGMDCKPQAIIKPAPPSKIHQLRFLPCNASFTSPGNAVLAVSTEDGRILFYDITSSLTPASTSTTTIPSCPALAQLGGLASEQNSSNRIKAFEILAVPESPERLVLAAHSDGAIRLWRLDPASLTPSPSSDAEEEARQTKQVGTLLATHETGQRITCLAAFVLTESASAASADGEDEFGGFSDAADGTEEESSESESG